MLANVGKNVQTKKFLIQKLNEPAVETYFLLERTYGAENGPPFLDLQPYDAENGPPFLDLQPCGAENGPPFLDMQPCGAEKIRFFLTPDPAAPSQKRISTAIKHAQRQGEG